MAWFPSFAETAARNQFHVVSAICALMSNKMAALGDENSRSSKGICGHHEVSSMEVHGESLGGRSWYLFFAWLVFSDPKNRKFPKCSIQSLAPKFMHPLEIDPEKVRGISKGLMGTHHPPILYRFIQ